MEVKDKDIQPNLRSALICTLYCPCKTTYGCFAHEVTLNTTCLSAVPNHYLHHTFNTRTQQYSRARMQSRFTANQKKGKYSRYH